MIQHYHAERGNDFGFWILVLDFGFLLFCLVFGQEVRIRLFRLLIMKCSVLIVGALEMDSRYSKSFHLATVFQSESRLC